MYNEGQPKPLGKIMKLNMGTLSVQKSPESAATLFMKTGTIVP